MAPRPHMATYNLLPANLELRMRERIAAGCCPMCVTVLIPLEELRCDPATIGVWLEAGDWASAGLVGCVAYDVVIHAIRFRPVQPLIDIEGAAVGVMALYATGRIADVKSDPDLVH